MTSAPPPRRPWLIASTPHWFRPPRLRTLEATHERHASSLELFFDLVFVVAITQLARELVHDHSALGFGRFVALFLPVFVAWQGFSFYADRFDTDDVVFRIATFAGMLAIAALAIRIPGAFRGGGAGFAFAYVMLRVLLLALYARAWRHAAAARPLIRRYAAGYSLSVAIWAISVFTPEPARYALWAAGMLADLAVPWISTRLHRTAPVDVTHVPERFGLFTIIVLGESIVAIALGTAASTWRAPAVVTAIAGFAGAAALWWVYFGTGAGLRLHRSAVRIVTFAYAHLPLLMALTAFGAGLHIAIDEAAHHALGDGARWAVCGGAALFLLGTSAAQRMTDDPVPGSVITARAAAAVALLLVGALHHGSAVTALLMVSAILLALVALELWICGLAPEDDIGSEPRLHAAKEVP